jgi:glycosyltransferase involved in cell wall biosynthesis
VKRVVFVAPGVAPPWTEGRKNFVRDLDQTLRLAGHSVKVLSGGVTAENSSSRVSLALAPVSVLFELRAYLHDQKNIDAVVLFPYGRFNGVTGAVNQAFLRLGQRISRAKGSPQVPLFYSCAGLSLEVLSARFAPAMAVGRTAPGLKRISLGINHRDLRWRNASDVPIRLLFLCGYQKAKPSVLQEVLDERGLSDLLAAGNALAESGMQLTIAIPFLRNASMRALLESEIARLCPALIVQLSGDVPPADALMTHDVFVFPYRAEHAVFVPTSLLEAMSIGIPVVAADHAMYHDLTHDGENLRCTLHRPGDPSDLTRAVKEMAQSYPAAITRAGRAREQIRAQWTLQRCADELLAAL